jgi:hypothetical protein
MDAIVTAGGIPLPEEPLYPATQGESKALVDVAGKPMVQWVLDALTGCKTVENVIVVGLTEKSGLKCGKKMYFVPNQGKIVDNLQAGARKVIEINKKAKQVLLVSSDIPAITSEMIDWVTTNAMQSEADVFYHIVTREVMDARYPGSKRTFTHLKDMEVCGGDLNVARIKFLTADDTDIWTRITDARKSPLKQASMFGYDTAFLLLIGQLTLAEAVRRITTRLNFAGQAVVCPFAEVGMDVDKPLQLAMIREDFKKRLKKAPASKAKQAAKKKAVAKKSVAASAKGNKSTAKAPVKKSSAPAAARKSTASGKAKTSPAKKTAKKTARK